MDRSSASDLICEFCGDSYYVKPCKRERSRFCSRECMIEDSKNRVTKTCEYCGDEYEIKASHAEGSRFCSRSCKDTWKREVKPTERNRLTTVACATCGAWLKRDRYDAKRHERHFCDDQCRGEWMSDHLTGDNAPNWCGGFVHDFGENWFEMRKRDEVCQACGEDGSSTFLDVHHIIPQREFEVPEHANTMMNLVLLCRPCHTTAEQNMAYCPIPQVRSNGTTYVESADLSIGVGIQQFPSID